MALVISNKLAKTTRVRPLWNAIYRQGYIGTVGKHITGTFTGSYEAHDTGRRVGTLTLYDVHNLQVQTEPLDSSGH